MREGLQADQAVTRAKPPTIGRERLDDELRDAGEEARRGGCTRYLEKPQRPLDVLHAVEDVIGPPPPDAYGQPPTMDTD